MKPRFTKRTAEGVMRSVLATDMRQSAARIVKGSEREYLRRIHERKQRTRNQGKE